MSIQEIISAAVAEFLGSTYNHEVDASSVQIDKTRKEFEGDYTVVVFPFVRVMKNSPEKAGEELGNYLVSSLDIVDSFNVIKGFLNVSLTSSCWLSQLTSDMHHQTWNAFDDNGRTVLVEYSSPNTNKPLHLGHLRNNFLGHSVSLIKSFAGENVVKTQIINDRGVHICKSMLAWKKFGEGATPQSTGMKGDKLVGFFYVRYDKEFRAQVEAMVNDGMDEELAKKEAPLAKEVQQMLIDWEAGEPDTVALWKMMNEWVYDGFDQTYDRLGVEFDTLYYESDTYLKGKNIVLEGEKKGLFYTKDNGSKWVDLTDQGLDEKLLIRADGTTVYMTQDIGTAVQRFEDYPALKQIVYTVGDEQDYHFKVLFLILEKLGYAFAPACRHLSYGMVDLPSGKMKSREGTVVDADDLMQEVVDAARLSSEEKGKLDELTDEARNELYEILGIGALKFYLLRVDPKKRMMFDPAESVALNGDTGPFVQYTYARCMAVLRKAGEGSTPANHTLNAKEASLLRELTAYKSVVKEAAEQMNPSLIANYCLDIAKLYNQFYHDNPILKEEGDVRDFRVMLTRYTANVIESGMALLGIKVPERM